MDQILAIRPFVPAKDFDASKRFYRAPGFTLTHEDESIAILKLGNFSFILQNFYALPIARRAFEKRVRARMACVFQVITFNIIAGDNLPPVTIA